MSYRETILTKVEAAIGAARDDEMRRRRARLEIAHGLFHALERASSELDESRRLHSSGLSLGTEGETMESEFHLLRAKLARRAAARELAAATAGFFALVRLSVGTSAAGVDMYEGLEEEDAAWLANVMGAGA